MSQQKTPTSSIRLGLCCQFQDEPIKFRNTTVKANKNLDRPAALEKLAQLCQENARSLQAALEYCVQHDIGCFRINSQILPLKTHAECGYQMRDLPGGKAIVKRFQQCGDYVRKHGLRTCFHPDQFVVLNSPREEVVERSIAELEYQAEVAEWVGADVLNIHGGGAYGDKPAALKRFEQNLKRLSKRVRSRLTVENDDTTFSPADLLPLCHKTGIPLVYDVHHHRCLPDGLSIEAATEQALSTWNREPLFHLSSPKEGWKGKNPKPHHDFIDVKDFPSCWEGPEITVEVEAKAKEQAVLKLMRSLRKRGC